jgi:hypothetical protein
MFEIAKHFRVQLICLFDLNKADITACFDNFIKTTVKPLKYLKDEFKDVISEYFYYVLYSSYKESDLSDYSIIDTEILIQLGLPIYADNADIKRRFREFAKTYHPDNGGDSAKFIEMMEKYKNFKN